jgi:hypothetical protein
MASRYYAIEVSFGHNNKWEQVGERYPLMHKAVEHMEAIDLTFPTRISKITKEVVLAEKVNGKRKKNPERKRMVKKA